MEALITFLLWLLMSVVIGMGIVILVTYASTLV